MLAVPRRVRVMVLVTYLLLVFAAMVRPSGGTAAFREAPTTFQEASGVLLSEVTDGPHPFVELTNYGSRPQDLSGWKIERCGYTGDAFGYVDTLNNGTVLKPGEQWTITGKGGSIVDARYKAQLKPWGWGVRLVKPDETPVDAIGFYGAAVSTDCSMDTKANPTGTLQATPNHDLRQSAQRVNDTGNVDTDWILAEQTPESPNRSHASPIRSGSPVRITEVANGGPDGYDDQFIELRNTGDEPVDVRGWRLIRCTADGATRPLASNLGTTTIAAGGVVVVNKLTGPLGWNQFGVIVADKDLRIADRMGVHAGRVSPCSSGDPITPAPVNWRSGSYQRIADTGDDAHDFTTGARSPGTVPADPLPVPHPIGTSDITIDEVSPAGPGGRNDEFFELRNTGTSPIDTRGWTVHACTSNGRLSLTPLVTLPNAMAAGARFTAAHARAPRAVRSVADATYTTGLIDDTRPLTLTMPYQYLAGYGLLVIDANGDPVEGLGSWETLSGSACELGGQVRNAGEYDRGQSYQFAPAAGTSTGNDEDDYTLLPRTPGAATVAAPEVTVDPRRFATGSPVARPAARALPDSAHAAAVTRRVGGWTTAAPPSTLDVADVGQADRSAHEFIRLTLAASAPETFLWQGTTTSGNEVQLYAWRDNRWKLIDASEADDSGANGSGTVTLSGPVKPSSGTAEVLILDGPRTKGGLLGTRDKNTDAFADPTNYDFALTHVSDTQFLSEGYAGVFADEISWVLGQATYRKIDYTIQTGDVVENHLVGSSDPARPAREYALALNNMNQLTKAGLANGVLPGNHDAFWGRDFDMFNQYFGPQSQQNSPWYLGPWREGDSSAHADRFTASGASFLVISLPYRPSAAQLAWASNLARTNPNDNVILATHGFLRTDGGYDDTSWRPSGRAPQIWKQVVVPNDNVFLVLCGHNHGTVTRVDTASPGRKVVQIMSNFQDFTSTQPTARFDGLDRDTGFLRLFQFDLDAGLMRATTYSPHLRTFDAQLYDAWAYRPLHRYQADDMQFTVRVDVHRQATLTETGTVVSSAISRIRER